MIPIFLVLFMSGLIVIVQGDACFEPYPVVSENLCSGDDNSVHIGDFDGDGKEDFVCHNSRTGVNTIYYASRSPFEETTFTIQWCTGVSLLFVGDFNKDGRSDLLCHGIISGYKWIAYADSEGRFKGTDWEDDMKFCTLLYELHVGDFDGDGLSDMLCQSRISSEQEVVYGSFLKFLSHVRFPGTMESCQGTLLTGDFNGDGKTDLLCHVYGSGEKRISLAGDYSNLFTKVDYAGQKGWCTHDGTYLRVGDINGDGLDDLICKDNSPEGNIWYSENIGKPKFLRTTFQSKFCSSSEEKNFHLADVTGDGKKDFLCINSYVQIGESQCE